MPAWRAISAARSLASRSASSAACCSVTSMHDAEDAARLDRAAVEVRAHHHPADAAVAAQDAELDLLPRRGLRQVGTDLVADALPVVGMDASRSSHSERSARAAAGSGRRWRTSARSSRSRADRWPSSRCRCRRRATPPRAGGPAPRPGAAARPARSRRARRRRRRAARRPRRARPRGASSRSASCRRRAGSAPPCRSAGRWRAPAPRRPSTSGMSSGWMNDAHLLDREALGPRLMLQHLKARSL